MISIDSNIKLDLIFLPFCVYNIVGVHIQELGLSEFFLLGVITSGLNTA